MSNPNPKNAANPSNRPAGTKPASATPSPTPAPPVKVPPLFRRVDWISCIITTLVVFAGYLYTLAPDLTLEDCGELATGSFYAGVPHPPGYPVWTVYSWIFTWLVPISNIAYRVAISSAVAGALSCGLVAAMVSRGSSMILEGIAELKGVTRGWENGLCVVSGFVGGMLIGFNGFMWSQAVIVEVYTLSVLSLAAVLMCMMRWIYAPHQRRYLYMAFFWYGICFNNHQSLLVIIIGMEVGIIAASPRLGRAFLFWNSVCYLAGLLAMTQGYGGLVSENLPVAVIFNLIGIASMILWAVLAVKTKLTAREFGRDVSFVVALGYLLILLLTITGYAEFSERKGMFAFLNLAGLGAIGGFVYLARETARLPKEWLVSFNAGLCFATGTGFYLYMALASMSNPPLNWGYPRTVQGFIHAFTRGQYERIHPTTEFSRFIDQLYMYAGGLLDEFNLVYLLIGIIPFFFIKKMQPRERSWLISLSAIYLTLSFFLLILLNPAPDRQSRDLNKVFFTAGHVMIAMGVGYGLTLMGAYLSLQLERFRKYCLYGALGAAGLALLLLGITYGSENGVQYNTLVVDLEASHSPVVRFTAVFSFVLALAGAAVLFFSRTRLLKVPLLLVFCAMPAWSVLSHWSDNEQRGHYFGYWFGHDMFTPPFKDPATGKLSYDAKRREELMKTPQGKLIYPEMDRDTVLYGGTDPGRFNPTYMIFCESFTPASKRNFMDPSYDRRDVALITQNALADGTYLNYIRAHYNRSAQIDPPFFTELARGPKELERGDKTNFLAKLAKPLDDFFLTLGDNIEKNRRVGESFFKDDHFKDFNAFVAKLKPGPQQDPVAKYLYENLSKETQQRLGAGSADASLKAALVKDLNKVIDRELANKDAWLPKVSQKAALEQQAAQIDAALKQANTVAGADAKDPAKAAKAAADSQRLAAEAQRVDGEVRKVQSELAGMMLYDAERFKGVKLTERTQRFIKQNPQSHTRVRLNRILLEETFPSEITKSLGGVYPDMEIQSATNEDSQRCFQEYLGDAQKRLDHDRRFPNEPRQIRPGEDVKIIDNRVQVSGQVAVMAINGLLTKVIFDKNPDREFYVEESFPLDWMYPHLTPYGIIMKINRNEVPEITEEMVERDHHFWSEFSTRSIGNWITYDTTISNICDFANQIYVRKEKPSTFKGDWAFIRDSDGQKAFSKLRSSIAGVYNWRLSKARSPQEQQRMIREAEFSFKQAYAFCPYSPEAIFRYVNLLVTLGRIDDALLLASTSLQLDKFNAQLDGLVVELRRIKASQAPAPAGAAVAPPLNPAAQVAALEQQVAAQPDNLGLGYSLAGAYIQMQQPEKANARLDMLAQHPTADTSLLLAVAQSYAQLGNVAGIERALTRLTKMTPDSPETHFDLAAVLAMQNKTTQAVASLTEALKQNGARRQKDGNAPNLYTNATNDARFAAVRGLPEYQQLVQTYK